MIKVEGFMAFRGTMTITPKCTGVAPFDIEGDWLYNPNTECWYGGGRSFGKDICTIKEDLYV